MSPIASRSPNLPAADDPSVACQRARACLSAFVDGEASPQEAAELLAHISRCSACRHAELGLRQLIAALQRSHVPVLASRRLQLRITQLFADQERTVSRAEGESDPSATPLDQG